MNLGRKLSVIAASDDKALIRELSSYNMEVEVVERNGNKVIEEVLLKKPDVLVTEAFLQYTDAVGVAEKLCRDMPLDKPLITVISNIGNSAFERELVRAGADCCFIKPVDGHILAQRIRALLDGDREKPRRDYANDIDVTISNMLREIGMPAHIKGYPYVREAIKLCVNDEEMLSSVTKILYPTVAKEFNSTPSRVERSIRHAIEAAWDRGDLDVLNSYFGYTIQNDRGKPTNSQFIATLTDDIKLNMRAYR